MRQFKNENTDILKVKGMKKIYHGNIKNEKAGVAILMSDKIYYKQKCYWR